MGGTIQGMSIVKKLIRRSLLAKSEITQRHARKEDYKRFRDRVLQPGVIGLDLGRGMTFVRIDPALNLSEQRSSSANRITRLIRELRIQYWQIPGPWNKPSRIGLLERDRARFISALRGAADLSHWILEPLGPNGRKHGTDRFLPAVNRNRKYDGVRLFENVMPTTTSSFRAGPQQGVELHFWVERPGYIESHVWNERFTKLPHPVDDGLQFLRTLEDASEKHADEVDFPIDVVYTWVDGSDVEWQTAKARAMEVSDPDSHVQDALDAARFADHDELRFSLRSIEQYAPWVNKIWLVTNGQIPPWLVDQHPRISVVTHQDIWPDDRGLPNFNSHAIEACLHRIEGLAEHFLYFNDDFFFGRPVRPETFFHGNGISKLFYSRALVDFLEINELDNASSVAAKNARDRLREAKVDKSNFSRKFFHVPTPIQRSLLEDAEVEFASAFDLTRRAQFRRTTDIAVAGSFYFNLAQARGRAVPSRIRYDYIDPAAPEGRRKLKAVVRHHNMDCIVINDGSTSETERQRRTTDIVIRNALQEFLPVRSSFESDPHSRVH